MFYPHINKHNFPISSVAVANHSSCVVIAKVRSHMPINLGWHHTMGCWKWEGNKASINSATGLLASIARILATFWFIIESCMDGTSHPQVQRNTSVMHVTHMWHKCARVYTHVHTCGLIVFMCELYMLCPPTMIYTYVYYYKFIAYVDRQACEKSTIWVQKMPIFCICSIIT